ncbi:MAG: helix-turn-helix transcriptional regulator [Chloroflexi bacterium]|nr:helix-turn-helix transcriptional regulator [Chloroflexota bacterium]
MRIQDTTNPACHAGMRTILSSTSARHQLEIAGRLRFHLVGLYYCEVGAEWSSQGKLESDYLHHIDIALAGRRKVVFRDEVLEINPGTAFWFPGNTPLERRCHERCKVLFLKLRCEWLPGVDPLLDWPDRRPKLIGPCDQSYWRAWLHPKHNPTTNRLLQLRARILEWVAAVVPDLDDVISRHLQTHAQFKEVFGLIEDKLGANLRVGELARAHGTSLHAFSMAFARNTGMSPKTYLERRLNQEAIQLLTNTELKVKQVADELKFCDEYHFSRFFSKANGIPPSRYRLALRQDND